jgi:hypothetical protein
MGLRRRCSLLAVAGGVLGRTQQLAGGAVGNIQVRLSQGLCGCARAWRKAAQPGVMCDVHSRFQTSNQDQQADSCMSTAVKDACWTLYCKLFMQTASIQVRNSTTDVVATWCSSSTSQGVKQCQPAQHYSMTGSLLTAVLSFLFRPCRRVRPPAGRCCKGCSGCSSRRQATCLWQQQRQQQRVQQVQHTSPVALRGWA